MFQFPGFPTFTYVFSKRSMILHHGCSHIRTSPDRSLFAAPRSFSQLVTSFIGSQCQGILHMLFYAWTTFLSLISFSSSLLKTVLSLAWIAMSSYILLFTVTLAFVYFAWRNFNTFVTCFTNYGKTWFIFNSWFFPYLVCHVLLFGFQWASKPYLTPSSRCQALQFLEFLQDPVKTGNLFRLLGYGLKWTRTTDLALIRRAL